MINKSEACKLYNYLFGLNGHRVFFFRAFVLSAAALFFYSCAATHYQQAGPCAAAIRPGDQCLVPWLPERNTEFYLKTLASVFKKKSIDLKYLPEEEWNLRASGILNPLDSAHFSELENSGYTHILIMKELSNQSENTMAYYTDVELNYENSISGFKPTWNERGNQSEIMLQLIPLKDIKAAHSIIAKTNISHGIIRGKNQGETYINPTSIESARYKAMKKAAKQILRQCVSTLKQ